MRPRLYMSEVCPCARAVILTAKVLGLTLELKEVEIHKGCDERGDSNTIKIHSVPTLEDSGYIIWDTHAIMAFLIGKYGQDDSLYPRAVEKRARIDQRLDFDSSLLRFTLNHHMSLLLRLCDVARGTGNGTDDIYEIVERFFESDDQRFVAGAEMTMADLSLIASITSLELLASLKIDEKRYPRVTRWIRVMEGMEFYEENRKGLCQIKRKIFGRCCEGVCC